MRTLERKPMKRLGFFRGNLRSHMRENSQKRWVGGEGARVDYNPGREAAKAQFESNNKSATLHGEARVRACNLLKNQRRVA